MNDLQEIKQELAQIKERNKKVEKEKAWETSSVRRISIALMTYVFMVSLMSVLKIDKPFLSAVFPTVGYLLSTLSIGIIKEWWIKN